MREMGFMEKLLDGAHVEWKSLASICKIETGKLNANAATEDGAYMFFTTAKEVSKIDKYRWDTEALLIAGNANVGDVKHYSGKFEAYQRTYVLTNFSEKLNVRYLFHIVSNSLKQYLEDRTNSAAMTYIVLSTLENFPIPIPCPDNPKKSLEIQAEIVRILDAMTAHTAELTAELTARKKQYDYYRDKLLSFEEGEVEWRTLGEVGRIVTGRTPKSSDKFAWGDEVDFVTPSDIKNGMRTIAYSGRRLSTAGSLVMSNVRIPSGSLLVTCIGADMGKTVINANDCIPNQQINAIVLTSKKIKVDYLFHVLSSMRDTLRQQGEKGGGTMPLINKSDFSKILIPIPDIDKQARIVAILDKFDALTSSLTEGLPREIELREKQYAYYRDLLLSFPAAQAA